MFLLLSDYYYLLIPASFSYCLDHFSYFVLFSTSIFYFSGISMFQVIFSLTACKLIQYNNVHCTFCFCGGWGGHLYNVELNLVMWCLFNNNEKSGYLLPPMVYFCKIQSVSLINCDFKVCPGLKRLKCVCQF